MQAALRSYHRSCMPGPRATTSPSASSRIAVARSSKPRASDAAISASPTSATSKGLRRRATATPATPLAVTASA